MSEHNRDKLFEQLETITRYTNEKPMSKKSFNAFLDSPRAADIHTESIGSANKNLAAMINESLIKDIGAMPELNVQVLSNKDPQVLQGASDKALTSSLNSAMENHHSFLAVSKLAEMKSMQNEKGLSVAAEKSAAGPSMI